MASACCHGYYAEGTLFMARMHCCTEGSNVGGCLDCVRDVYKCFLTGSCPSQSAADVANLMFRGMCATAPGQGSKCASAEHTEGLTCSCLTLVEKMASSLTSLSQPPEVTLYCTEILSALFQDMDLMLQLVHLFQAEDQIISHLAAKSVSTSVVYLIRKYGIINPVWQQKCVQTFYNSPPGIELDACLWSLTDVLKKLLRGAHQEILGKLVADFDSSVCVLCSKFLPKKTMQTQSLGDFISDGHWRTTFCLLLDLLEVLTSSSSISGAAVCLKSQRLTHLHSSALLYTISCTSGYFVKKRVLLLLKRAALQKAGEEWALEEVLSTGLKHEHFSSDMNMLAENVLTAVAANWLHSVQVESPSFFGGTRHVRYDQDQKSDCVILRAVGLLLLKSIELHVQTPSETAEVDRASELCGYLQKLCGFLRQCSVQLSETSHLCCWVSLVFREQDDDMMEASKVLLSLVLQHRVYSSLDGTSVMEAACACGYNPHCHFLFLLQSVSFDHSILLDFLISNETCFLEYFVRYLKYLTVDWQGFNAACERICMSDSPLSFVMMFSCSCHRDASALAYKCQPQVEKISLAAGPRLVEYASSDECDQENGSFITLDINQETSGPQKSQQQGLSMEHVSAHNTCKNKASLSKVTCETSVRTVRCLSDLKEVVTRLQTKKLFPFNPSSLLKLLAQVQKCFQQCQLSQFPSIN